MRFFKNTMIAEYSALADTALKEAFESVRHRSKVSHRAQRLTGNMASRYLHAVSHKARAIWGKSISAEIARFFCPDGELQHCQRIYLVTLVHSECVTAISDTQPDVERFKAYLRYGLRGYSYLGSVEPAYYTNVQVGIGAKIEDRQCIFWHLHVLLWGSSKQKCGRLIRKLNESGRYQPIIREFRGAHRKLVRQGDLPTVLGYIFKPPGVAYRLWQAERLRYDKPVRRLRQATSSLRPGERINLFNAMSDLYLDQLAVAGGEGVALLAAAKKTARRRSGYEKILAQERMDKRRRSRIR